MQKEHHKIQATHALNRIYHILHELKEALKNNDIPKTNTLYIEARNLYIELETEEKKKVYSELTSLYNKLIMLAKEEELKRKKSEELTKRPTIFGRLFKAKEQPTKTQAKEKPKEQKSTESEFEELEEAIRNLGLFKKIEKERGGVKESKEKPSIFGKLFKK